MILRYARLMSLPKSTLSNSLKNCLRSYLLIQADKKSRSSWFPTCTARSIFSLKKISSISSEIRLFRIALREGRGGNGAETCSNFSGFIVRIHFEHLPQLTFMASRQTVKFASADSHSAIFMILSTLRTSAPSCMISTYSFE